MIGVARINEILGDLYLASFHTAYYVFYVNPNRVVEWNKHVKP